MAQACRLPILLRPSVLEAWALHGGRGWWRVMVRGIFIAQWNTKSGDGLRFTHLWQYWGIGLVCDWFYVFLYECSTIGTMVLQVLVDVIQTCKMGLQPDRWSSQRTGSNCPVPRSWPSSFRPTRRWIIAVMKQPMGIPWESRWNLEDDPMEESCSESTFHTFSPGWSISRSCHFTDHYIYMISVLINISIMI